MTCIERKERAAKTLEDYPASSQDKEAARAILKEKSCDSCKNPLVYQLSIDNLLCEKK